MWRAAITVGDFLIPTKIYDSDEALAVRFSRGQPLGFYSSWPVHTQSSYEGVDGHQEGAM